ncbi:MAG: T9SS type A sorting domain-containing protein [Bacteroidetes bacterium]|nr:T9SS type A sorting domain-containing protein [Bacteroidota bacterium]
MRKIITAALFFMSVLMLGQEAAAQGQLMPLPPHSSTYTGYSRGFWFTAPTSFFIEGVRAPTDASASADQNVYIVRFAAAPPALPGTSNYTVLGEWYSVPGTNVIPCHILVNAGDFIGVMGHRGSLPATNFNAINSYSASFTPGYATNILGYPTTLIRLMYQDNILNAHAQNPPLTPAQMPLGTSSGQIGRVELYVGPPCVIPDLSFDVDVVDASGFSLGYTSVPSSIWIKYAVRYPQGSSNVGITLEFRRIGDASQIPAYVATLTDVKPAGQNLVAQQMVSLPASLQPGYYLIKPIINSMNSCEEYQDTELPEELLLVIPPGSNLCSVWPGDVNNDDVVNYTDRKDLNRYIYDANLRSSWLEGPARFRYDAETNPLTYIEWSEQPGIPWETPEGCYMDTDGNGFINNFDYIAIKMNWLRTHGEVAGKRDSFSPMTFDMDQNFPNPFNPSTTIQYSVPEQSQVKLIVTDMLGRTIATLVSGTVEEGVHTATFDAANLNSGSYVATISMAGLQSGLSFSKTIKMVLNK